MKNFLKKIIFSFFGIALLLMPAVVFGQDFLDDAIRDANDVAQGAGYSQTTENAQADLIDIAVNVINIALSFIATILFIIIVYAGFRYMTAGGNDGQIQESITWIKNGVIGIVIILMAAGIVNFIIRNVLETLI
jgi:heme/copper-type cytochrome/quinol oxidase subunit 2